MALPTTSHHLNQCWFIVKWPLYYTRRFNEVERGYTGFILSVFPSVDRMVSALYLQQYSSDSFHICTSYQAASEGVSPVKFVSKFTNIWEVLEIWLCLLLTWDPIWLNSMGNHVGGGGYPQNAGVLLVLVLTYNGASTLWEMFNLQTQIITQQNPIHCCPRNNIQRLYSSTSHIDSFFSVDLRTYHKGE